MKLSKMKSVGPLAVSAIALLVTDVKAEIEIQEIVVTARKKEENLQDVPIAVKTYTGENLREQGLSSIVDVGDFTPNVKFESGTTDVGGAANATLFIRGIGQLDYSPTIDMGVGLYVDGVYLGRAQGGVLELADIQSIEILKGPQGTLFGKNTMGGAINVTTSMPEFELGGSAAITVGEDERFNLDGDINLPLGEKLAMRVSASYRSQEGYVNRPLVGDKVGDEGTFVGRAKFLYEPSENTSVLLSFDYTKIDAQANTALTALNQPTNLAALWNAFVGIPGGTPVGPQFTSPDLETSFGTGSSQLDYEGGGVSLRIDHDFGGVSGRSITAYRTFDSRNQRDNDSSPVDFGQLDYADEQWQFSQEFNLFGTLFNDSLSYTAGLYYFQEDADSAWTVNLAPGLYQAFEALPGPIFPLVPGTTCPNADPMIPCAGGAGNPLNVGFDIGGQLLPQIDAKSYAAFLELEWQLSDTVTAIAGGRITHDEKDYSYLQTRFVSGIPTVPLTTTSESWTNFSPRLGLTFKPGDDLLLYATFSGGYKAGGFNGRPANPTVAQLAFDPEKLWAYEVGFKSDLMNRRVRLNGAAFFYDYKNMQLQANDLVGNQTVQVIDNVGSAELWGVELDMQWLIAEGLTFYGSAAYLNAEYKETQEQITGVALDTKLAKTPEWTATAALEYRAMVMNGEGLLRVDYSYTDESFADVRNTPQLRQKAHSLVNARAAWTTPNETFTIAAYGKNIFDERFVLNGFDVSIATGSIIVIPNQPRELGVQGIVRF